MIFGPSLIEKLVKAILNKGKEDVDKIDDKELANHVQREVEMVANEAAIYFEMAYIAMREGTDKAMEYFFGTHDGEEYKKYLGGKNETI